MMSSSSDPAGAAAAAAAAGAAAAAWDKTGNGGRGGGCVTSSGVSVTPGSKGDVNGDRGVGDGKGDAAAAGAEGRSAATVPSPVSHPARPEAVSVEGGGGRNAGADAMEVEEAVAGDHSESRREKVSGNILGGSKRKRDDGDSGVGDGVAAAAAESDSRSLTDKSDKPGHGGTPGDDGDGLRIRAPGGANHRPPPARARRRRSVVVRKLWDPVLQLALFEDTVGNSAGAPAGTAAQEGGDAAAASDRNSLPGTVLGNGSGSTSGTGSGSVSGSTTTTVGPE